MKSSDNGISWSLFPYVYVVTVNEPPLREDFIAKNIKSDPVNPNFTWFTSGTNLYRIDESSAPAEIKLIYSIYGGSFWRKRVLKDLEVQAINGGTTTRIVLASMDINSANGGSTIFINDNNGAVGSWIEVTPDANIDRIDIELEPSSQNLARALYVKQTSLPLKITEVTHDLSQQGAQSTFPAYMVGSNSSDDFIEITNLGGSTINLVDLNNLVIETWTSFGLESSSIIQSHASVSLNSGETMILASGNGMDDITNNFVYLRGANPNDAHTSTSTDEVGYILKFVNSSGANVLLDVVSVNGYVFPQSSGVTTLHWNPATSIVMDNMAGIQLSGIDNNSGSSWTNSSSVVTTFGSLNLNLSANLNVSGKEVGTSSFDFSTQNWSAFINSTLTLQNDISVNSLEFKITHPVSGNSTWFCAGIKGFKSTTQGQNWSSFSMGHDDVRDFEAIPLTNEILIGTDGGVSETNTIGGTQSAFNINGTGLDIGEFQSVSRPQNNFDKIIASAMHNHIWTRNSSTWTLSLCGDGFNSKYLDESPQVGVKQCNFSFSATSNDWSTSTNIYTAPMSSSTHGELHPARVLLYPSSPPSLYVGWHDLFFYSDVNSSYNVNLSNIISVGGCLNQDIKNNIQTFDVALSNQATIYSSYSGPLWDTPKPPAVCPQPAGICGDFLLCPKGILYKSIDGGLSWTDLTPNLPTFNFPTNDRSIIQYIPITSLIISPTDDDVVWVTFGSICPTNPVGLFRVIKTTDGGQTWVDYSDGLPNLPANCIKYQKGSNDALYIGTDAGVFYRDNSLSSWVCFNKDLPVGIVTDLDINYCKQKITAALYSGGIWESDLYASKVSISGTTNLFNQTKDITNDIVIPSGSTLNISSCTLNIAKGRRITVEAGGHLVILASQLTNSCDEMWDGIYVENGGTLAMGSCTLQNAYRAVNLDNGSISSIEDCTFDKNFIGISSHDFNGSSTSTIYPTTYIAGCTFDCSGNLPPYFGGSTAPIALSWAYTGIQLSNVGAMFVGDVAKNVNTFQNLTNGIVSAGSNLEVVNSKFRHIVDYHVYNNTHDGTAILSAGGNGVYSLRVTGLGTPAMTSPTNQTFLDCKAGIKTFRNVGSWIESCWMEDVDYGFEAFRCNYVNSTITNNYFDCNFMGTLFNQCDINNVLSIGDNTYVMTPASRYITTLPSYAIQVLESGFQNYSSAHLIVAQNNILLEFGLGGILISNVNNAWVKWNQVTTFQNNNDPNSSDLVNAISVNGCDQAYVSCNQIQSMDNTSSSEQIGLHSSGSENGRYLCNNITSGFHGMHFGGSGYGNEISGNVFSDYYIGFYIESTGYSGSQFHNGNVWDDINPNSPIGAFNNNSTSLAFTQLSLFDVNGSLVSDVHPTNNLETPIWGLPAWFTDDPSTDDYMCGSSLECAIVDVWEPNPNIDDINAADYVIANGQVGAENYSEQLVWTSKMNLYKKLDRIKNELPPSEPLLNFYDELANSTIAKLEEINNLISNGSEVDPVYGSILQGNIDPLNVSFENLKLKYESYFNETDDSVRLTYMLDIEMLQSQIQSLSSNSNNAILQIENLRTAEVLQAELENGGIETQVAIEENERLMKDILANYLDESFERFTEEDSLIINEIATKCPYEGGCRAVYLARSFYYMLHGPTFFNDPDKCTPLGYFRKSNKDYFEDNAIQVVPNPFQNSLQIILGQELSENGEFVLFNLIGERVLNVDLSKDQKQFEVLTQNIKSGFYYFKIVSNNSVFGTGKILKVGE
ncbi:MAG: T9SS type A sorting domain-containing protein [Bacteroidetes bacterium]|nr:MAG: T9SS type A sorting domain-containing protein [Bacteroidota bacterium]